MIDIKRAVKHPVTFEYYCDQSLWYKTVDGDIFPVPIEDARSATFSAKERGMYLMRWMRKWNKEILQENN